MSTAAFADGGVVIREKNNVIFFIRTDSFVALRSFSFLKAYASEDTEEDNEIEGSGGRKSFYQKPETQNGRTIKNEQWLRDWQ